MSWLDNSIMARKGLAKGKPGESYSLTEQDQGKYHYVYGPFAAPILKVDPGAVIAQETHDAFEGAIKNETDRPSEILNFPFLNPQNGPIYVNGAEKGDTLAVYIKSIVQDIARTIVDLNRRTNVTVVVVEQNLDMIRAMAQRCYVMDKGRIVAALTPEDLDDRETVRRHLAV